MSQRNGSSRRRAAAGRIVVSVEIDEIWWTEQLIELDFLKRHELNTDDWRRLRMAIGRALTAALAVKD